MTYKEKQDLTELLGELPEDKQARVVQIVAERHAELGGNEDDLIEINIEELDSVTLWKLDRYVRSCLKPKKKKQTQEEMLLEAQRMEQEAERELMQVEASLGVGGHAPPAAEVPVAAPAARQGQRLRRHLRQQQRLRLRLGLGLGLVRQRGGRRVEP